MIKENLNKVLENIEKAAKVSGRSPEDITLIGVSKTIAPENIQTLVDLGVKNLGENKVQELVSKMPVIKGDVKWHLIGSLQSNKIKYIAGQVFLIHSVDSIKLAENINKEAKKRDITIDILVEINIGNEETKHGFFLEEAEKAIEKISLLSNISIRGLMCIAPFKEDPEENRPLFRAMKALYDKYAKESPHSIHMEYLSMGMTNDYEIAIEEGSNMVRIGTGLFGKRVYQK